ncbi:MAG: DegT/DnrJ/EryC1/StrS family aminotransferase [Verrucomicrobiota bacterium]|nr:DegT/DnrJ/EryC1/StrS family aminotransferase [Verrucomicrobiota bacterium]
MENKVRFVDLIAAHNELKAPLEAAFDSIIADGSFILGRDLEAFESEFAAYIGTRYCVGVSNGLDALKLSLMVAGIGPGHEVIVPANTYIATALAVSACGATPVLVDCEPVYFGMDPILVADAITKRTRAIIPVHLYGQSCDMAEISKIAAQHDLAIIEDACQAHGSYYDKRRCGNLGLLGCFSFFPGKNLGALGDGGAITTNDEDLVHKLHHLRNYGQAEKYNHVVTGYNHRLDNLQAAFLRVKLTKLDEWNERRREVAKSYNQMLMNLPGLVLPTERVSSRHVYHLYVVQAQRRDQLLARLREANIETGIHYPIPIHRQKAYATMNWDPEAFPVARRLATQSLSLPIHPHLRQDDVERVVSVIQSHMADEPLS